jgi:hypothetical protein
LEAFCLEDGFNSAVECTGGGCRLLVIVNLSAQDSVFPVAVLQEVDSALDNVGLKKQVRSVLIPGKAFSVTYEGPNATKDPLTELLKPIAERNRVTLTIDVEESVSFP